MNCVTEVDPIVEAFNRMNIAIMIEVESGHSVDSLLSVLQSYYEPQHLSSTFFNLL